MSFSFHNLWEVWYVQYHVELSDTVNIFSESERREDSFPTNYNSFQGKQWDKNMTPNMRFPHLEKISLYIKYHLGGLLYVNLNIIALSQGAIILILHIIALLAILWKYQYNSSLSGGLLYWYFSYNSPPRYYIDISI